MVLLHIIVEYLHAGLYYKPGSLKANLSIDGGHKLKTGVLKMIYQF